MELQFCAVVFLLSVSFGNVASNTDECDRAKELDRSPVSVNDNTLTEGWYKVNNYKLEDEPLQRNECGTKYPVWGKGQYPEDREKVDIVGCVVSDSEDCATNISIKIQDCGDHHVYFLKPTTSSDQAYCFRKDGHDDDDDDDDCEDDKHHGKKFHRCRRNHRSFVVVIGLVAIIVALITIGAFIVYRRRKAAAQARKDQYAEKTPQSAEGPVVVVSNDTLPPKY